MEAIKAIRNIKAEKNVAPSKKIKAIILAEGEKAETAKAGEAYLRNLANITEILFTDSKKDVPEDAVSAVIDGAEIYIPLDDLARLEKEQKRLEGEVKRSNGMLNNPGFVNKAPEAKIQAEKEKLAMYEDMLAKVSAQIEAIKTKLQ